MEIKLDRKNSGKEKDGEGHPRTHSWSFWQEEKSPKTQKNKGENPCLGKKRKVQMAKISAKGIDHEDRNERKVKGSAHLRLKRTNRVLTRWKKSSDREFRFFRKPFFSEGNARKSNV